MSQSNIKGSKVKRSKITFVSILYLVFIVFVFSCYVLLINAFTGFKNVSKWIKICHWQERDRCLRGWINKMTLKVLMYSNVKGLMENLSILSIMPPDVLNIHITTMAWEWAFREGGCIYL